MKTFLYYLTVSAQLVGFAFVGLCLFSGIQKGDYGKPELFQFITGMILFYLGQALKKNFSS